MDVFLDAGVIYEDIGTQEIRPWDPVATVVFSSVYLATNCVDLVVF